MRFILLFIATLGITGVVWVSASNRLAHVQAGTAAESASELDKPYGIAKRTLWNDSRVVGSPDPPLPYRPRRAFPKLKLPFPMGIIHEPGTRNLVLVHQMAAWTGKGQIQRIKDDPNVENPEPLLEIDGIAFGVAFHPDFLQNGLVFVGMNGPYRSSPKKTKVIRYTVDRQPPYKWNPSSATLIIEWESDGHNGGDLAFGTDGMLYVTSGDGTSDSDTNLAGQDLGKLLSKVLRIDVDRPEPGKKYSVPRDNPFVGMPGVRPETWAYGFRNPWRIFIDKPTGDVWVGQNGQDLWEQVYLVQKGANYGWSVTEGSHPFYPNRKQGPHPIQPPIAEHSHSEMRSISGGVVYRGKKLPDLYGAYVYGDWSTGRIYGIRHDKGKLVWQQLLVNSTMQITGFGLDSEGELLVADHGSGYYYLEPIPKQDQPSKFPRRLSETGLFRSAKNHEVHPGLIPYSVASPLWSDGAEKDRYIAIPGQGQIEMTYAGGWNFPEGTVLVKTFSLPTNGQETGTMRRIETRLLTKQVGQWVGYSYIWNADQTDADLVANAGMDKTYDVVDRDAPGGVRKQVWHYPSRTECMVCHSRAANYVLGLSTVQMNRVHQYPAAADNQLRTLAHIGVLRLSQLSNLEESRVKTLNFFSSVEKLVGRHLTVAAKALPASIQNRLSDPRSIFWETFGEIERDLKANPRPSLQLPKPASEYPRLVDPYDAKEPLESRVRSYLQSNCAQCHVMAGGGNAQMELDFFTPREKMNILGVKPVHHNYGIADARLIAPGSVDRSVLLHRISRRGEGQMPPLATSIVDREAVRLLSEWIQQLR